MQRRKFLLDGGRAALGTGAFWLCGCASSTPQIPKDSYLQSLIAAWEAGIPQWLSETRMPAVSIAIVRDGRRAFVGSQSLRKLELDERREVGLIVRAAPIVKEIQRVFEEDWAKT